jgi:hypothetical protein
LALIGLFRSRASLQAEILTLRHQLNVLRRKSPQRLTFTSIDRMVFAGLYRLAPGVLDALEIVRPETVIRWHRAGFRAYWRWIFLQSVGSLRHSGSREIRAVSSIEETQRDDRLRAEIIERASCATSTSISIKLVRDTGSAPETMLNSSRRLE